jgi:hypothetical protein
VWTVRKVEEAFDDAKVVIVPLNRKALDISDEPCDVKLLGLDKMLLTAREDMILQLPRAEGGKRHIARPTWTARGFSSKQERRDPDGDICSSITCTQSFRYTDQQPREWITV